MRFNIGALIWLTTIIAFGVMLAIYGVMNERKEHSLQFVLSLPLSVSDYVRAKLLGLLLCFLGPGWSRPPAPPCWCWPCPTCRTDCCPTVLLCVFMLTNFSLVLCGTLHVRSEAAMTAVIVVTNMGVSCSCSPSVPCRPSRTTCTGPRRCGTTPSSRCSSSNSRRRRHAAAAYFWPRDAATSSEGIHQ